ncbi:uncharacterized protein LOC130732179 [Lotus japonicus]|uniref:uncharacterized protein LOC130732179 n=1 Tax=Lotus japonicus TaxID=34305 RepID=UPI0025833725|nr:uncharacterized protein LOC130732179 [Lotus japonicus]
MAPSKRKQPEPPTSPPRTRTASRSNMRVTRSTAAATGSPLYSGVLPPTRKTKKAKQEEGSSSGKPSAPSGSGSSSSAAAAKRIIVIEFCLLSDKFQTRANEVREALEPKLPAGTTVILNPKKARKGCFEIREKGGEKFISLLKLKDPYDALMALDINKIVTDITEQIAADSISNEIGGLAIDT